MSKVTPFSLEIEQAILGCIFFNPSQIISLADRINIDDFFDKRNQLIFASFKKLNEQHLNIDYTTVIQDLTNNNQLELAGGIGYISMLTDAVASEKNLDNYVEILINFSLKRQMIDVANEIMNIGYDNSYTSESYLDLAEEKVFEVAKRRKTSAFMTMGELTNIVKEKAEANQQTKDGLTGLNTGYSKLNELNSGLQPEQLIIIAARPSMGKSAFATNLALNVAKNNKNGKAGVAIFSLEMSNEQIAQRMISCESKILSEKLNNGNLTKEDWLLFQSTNNLFQKLNIYFDDSSGITIGEIRAKCRKLAQQGNLDLVIIDYLQLISLEGNTSNRQEEVSKISRLLKQMARELKIPVIALSQLSREVDKSESKIPVMAHLRESGSIEQDADVIMFLYRDDYYNPSSDRKGETDVIVAKNRSGKSGFKIEFIFEAPFSCFKQKNDYVNEGAEYDND